MLLDVTTLREETPPDQLATQRHRPGSRCAPARPCVADPYAENRTTGAFILVDEDSNDTVGAGMVREGARGRAARASRIRPASRGTTPGLGRSHRWDRSRTRGATVWLTGLPASGKSSVAAALERLLVESGHAAYFLDGDNLRHGLSGDLGLLARRPDGEHPPRRARRAADGGRGMVSIASLVSPAHHDRALARDLHAAAGLPFIEVHVDTPVEVCEQRDPKGLYARARAGLLKDFTGISAPYEVPENPEGTMRGADEDAKEAALRIRAALERVWAAPGTSATE